MENVEYKSFESNEHLSGVLALCEAEGWEGFVSDPDRAVSSLTAPGISTVVAVEEEDVVGFAQIQSDGVLQAHLSLAAVDAEHRGCGIGKRLVEEAFERSGGERVDIISTEGSETFYESFHHKARRGFRIYPRPPRRRD